MVSKVFIPKDTLETMSNGQLLFAHEIYVSKVNHLWKSLGKNEELMKLVEVNNLLAGADVKKEIDLLSSLMKDKKGKERTDLQ